MTTHTPTQAQRTLAAVQSAQRCALCLERECECWTDIARIVNAHDALVAALRVAQEVFASQADPEHALHDKRINWRDLYDHTRAALKLAEGPPSP